MPGRSFLLSTAVTQGKRSTQPRSDVLEAECLRNVELMWLLGRLNPDHKSIAEFRRIHREAVASAGVELVRFAKSCGLIRGEWIAIDGSKFRAVASIDCTRERLDLQRYLDSMEKADEEQQVSTDRCAVQTALQKLTQHPEPEVSFMLMGRPQWTQNIR